MREQIRTIFAALEFIEDHLDQPITVADIAAATGYSLYHFIRTFNQIARHTPYDYLMRRRLSVAARQLLSGERRVIDIALDFQFNSHETFTRAFGRFLGMPPTEWRQRGYLDDRILMPALSLDDLEYMNAPEFEHPRRVELDRIVLAGWMISLEGGHEAVKLLWCDFRKALQDLSLTGERRDFWGVHIQPQIPGRIAFYLAAIKISAVESTPPTMVSKILPAGEYICQSCENFSSNIASPLKYLYHTFLPQVGFFPAHPWEIEHFGKQHDIFIPVQSRQANF